MLELDNSVFIQIISFVIFCFLLKRVLYDPMSRVLDERRDLTEGRQKKAEVILREVHSVEEQLAARLDETKREIAAKKEEIRRAVMEEQEKIVRQVCEQTERMLAETRLAIQEETDRARAMLRKEAEDFSAEIVERVLA